MEIQQLIEHLKKEISVYKEFIAVLHNETENVVARDYKNLYDTICGKEHLLARIGSLGRERRELMSAAARANGLEGGSTLTSIMEKAQDPLKTELKGCQATIFSLIESVKDINKVNSIAVKGSLDNIRKTLGFLSSFIPNANYKPTGTFDGIEVKGGRLNKGA
ncbi:MAG: flagellar protein FlgN [Deltaproteobacteria bacterium]|nr:flagellar protein FlgN [Deltaproteobacteria bacterium]